MARDEKGRFLPGNTEGHRFTRNGDAREAGAKGTAIREANKKERQTLADALKNIRALSSEVVADGSMVVPYALIDGIVVSGK